MVNVYFNIMANWFDQSLWVVPFQINILVSDNNKRTIETKPEKKKKGQQNNKEKIMLNNYILKYTKNFEFMWNELTSCIRIDLNVYVFKHHLDLFFRFITIRLLTEYRLQFQQATLASANGNNMTRKSPFETYKAGNGAKYFITLFVAVHSSTKSNSPFKYFQDQAHLTLFFVKMKRGYHKFLG